MMENIIRIQRLPDYGYIIKDILVQLNPGDPWVTIQSAYNLKGKYIGNPADAFFICRTMKIKPETRLPDIPTCSIGFCKSDQKWYGWSHRGIYGFGIGHIVKKGDSGANKQGIGVGFRVNTLEDAKTAACAFAESIS